MRRSTSKDSPAPIDHLRVLGLNVPMPSPSETNPEKRILLPYFLAGSGHLVSANAIASYLQKKRPNWLCRLVEPADEFGSAALDSFFRRSWQLVLSRPKVASMGFALLDSLFPSIPAAVNSGIMRREMPHARNLIENFRPDLIATTHWGCGHLFQATREEYGIDVPLFLVRNDLGGAFQIQNCGSDLTFVMSAEAKQAFLDIGVEEDRLRQVNLLVRPDFVPDAVSKRDARRLFGVDESSTMVLLSAGGEGVGALEEYARATLEAFSLSSQSLSLFVLTGRNQELYSHLSNTFTDDRVSIQQYREDMHLLMGAADFVVGKCGANYTMESLMLRKFFVITQIGAPNEVHNMRFVVDNELGWYAPSVDEYRTILEKYLRGDPELDRVRNQIQKLDPVSGAEQIADAIIEHVE